MWLYLLGCSAIDALAPEEPVRGPIPSLEVDGVVRRAPTMARRMPDPEPLVAVDDAALLDASRPPYIDDVRAQVLADPDDPLLRELVSTWADDIYLPGHRQLLELLLQDGETCHAVLSLDDGTWGPALYDGCPWPMREAVVARYPQAADRDAWVLTPLPDDLASAFLDGTWVPSAVVRNYPEPQHGRVRRALERCATDAPSGYDAQACVLALADLDWAAARDQRGRLDEGPLRALLERFPTGQAVEAWLDAQGFPPRPDDAPVEAGSLAERLRRRGALWESFGSAARFPLLLDQLGLDDIVVRTLPSTPLGRYRTLHAHHDGTRHRVLLDPDYGADVEQLVGLANTLVDAVGPDEVHHAMWFEDPSLRWVVVTGPVAALEALIDEGFVAEPEPVYREGIDYVGDPQDLPVDTGPNLNLGL